MQKQFEYMWTERWASITQLNSLGKKGWEVVLMSDGQTYLLKREIFPEGPSL